MQSTDKKASASQEHPSLYYRLMRGILRLCYPRCRVRFEVPPEDAPSVFVCNHASIHAPIMMTLDFPRPHKNWMIACAMDKRRAKIYAYHDVFFGESHHCKPFWRFLSGIVGRGLPPLLRWSDPIPVYHDRRVAQTFRQSLAALRDGFDLVIFAEDARRFSEFVNELQTGFVDLGRMAWRESGRLLRFYPVYAEKKHRIISVGCPVCYDPETELAVQRQTAAATLRDSIDRLARALPPHKPVPFLPKRWYAAYGQYENNFAGYWKMIANEQEVEPC